MPNSKTYLSPFSIACASIGITIGGGVFLLSGIVGKSVGDYLPYLYLAAAIPMFFGTLPVVILGGIRPTNAGNYFYASRLLSPGWAFVAIWIFILTACLGQMPLYCLGAADYIVRIFGGGDRTQVAILVLFGFFFLNLFGFRPVLFLQTLMVFVLVASLILYIAFGFYNSIPKIVPDHPFPGFGVLAYGSALLTYTYFGANTVVELGSEVENPARTLPKVFYGSFGTISVLYLGVAFALGGRYSFEELQSIPNPVLESAESFFPKGFFGAFIFGGPLLAIATSINGLFLLGSTTLSSVVRDGILPGILGKRNVLFGTQHFILLSLLVLCLVGILAGFDWDLLAAFSALGWTLVFIPLLMGAFRLANYARSFSDRRFAFSPGFFLYSSLFGIFFQIGFSFLILSNLNSWAAAWILATLFASGSLYYLWRRRFLLARGTDLERIRLSPRDFLETDDSRVAILAENIK